MEHGVDDCFGCLLDDVVEIFFREVGSAVGGGGWEGLEGGLFLLERGGRGSRGAGTLFDEAAELGDEVAEGAA